jgi:hypothetical protein
MRWHSWHSRDVASLGKTTGTLYGPAGWALLLALLSYSGCGVRSSPPDLSTCTKVEIRWQPSLLVFFTYGFGGASAERLLSPAERQYLQSTEVFVIEDCNHIKLLAQRVSEGRHVRDSDARGSPWLWSHKVQITCYRGNEQMASFAIAVQGHHMMTQGGQRYRYPGGWDYWRVIEPPEIRPLKLRAACASNLRSLADLRPLERADVSSYPEPAGWCDAVVHFMESCYNVNHIEHTETRAYSDRQIAGAFLCTSVRESAREAVLHSEPNGSSAPVPDRSSLVSHYAMNPNCTPSSPADMVLLFETTPGWNQHGGPELFTFDHHEPKGGCVLLNDGTARFICTEEELKQLRWK